MQLCVIHRRVSATTKCKPFTLQFIAVAVSLLLTHNLLPTAELLVYDYCMERNRYRYGLFVSVYVRRRTVLRLCRERHARVD